MAASEIRIRVPHPSSLLVNNVLGVFGLVGSTVAVGGLTHNWWWALLLVSVYAVVVCLIGYTYAPGGSVATGADADASTGVDERPAGPVAAVPRSA